MVLHITSRLSTDKSQPRRRQIYEGKEKILFEGPEVGTVVLYFKDDLHHYDLEPQTITGKGAINNRISELFISRLSEIGVSHHFIKRLNMREQLVRSADVLPIQLTLYNYATRLLGKSFNVKEKTQLNRPLFEFSLKNSTYVLSRNHIFTFNLASEDECDEMMVIAQRVSDFLSGQIITYDLKLAKITLEFGRVFSGDELISLIIVDEISLDTCDFIDVDTNEILGRDCVTHGVEKSAKAYQTVAERLGILHIPSLRDR